MADSPSNRGQYIVVARRYRPQGFEDLVGQGMVSQALKNAIQTDRVGHAYLFTGARGVGKTSTARILSKALNCEHGPTETPCHKCDICESIAAGDDVDVLEIDGASNRGIDEIRQLRSNVSVRPSRSRFKIYIIDEVHMLTKEAFNALLKTLEEPPEHVKFIFCTTDPEKIPITVLSRCQRFDFSPVGVEEIVARLQHIVTTEGSEADDEALRLLARKAAGSVRDSQSLLEQLLSFTSDKITVEAVNSMLGTAGTARLFGVVSALASRDAASALRELDSAIGDGVDAGQLTEQLLGCIRDLLAMSVGGGKELLLHSSESDAEKLTEIGKSWGTPNLLAAAQIIDQTLGRMRMVTHSRVLLETALIRISQLEDLQDLSDLITQVQSGVAATPVKKKVAANPAEQQPASVDSTARVDPAHVAQPKSAKPERVAPSAAMANVAPSASTSRGNLSLDDGEQSATSDASASVSHPVAKDEPAPVVEEVTPEPQVASSNDVSDIDPESVWRQTIAKLDGMAADCASHFVNAANFAPNRLVVSFPASYTSSKSFCERPERLAETEKIVSRIAGKKLKVEFKVLADTSPKGAQKPIITARQLEREIAQRAFVQRAAELFQGDVTNVSIAKTDRG